jgi:hypothetical protein
MQGRVIRTHRPSGSQNLRNPIAIDLSDEPEGVYFLRAASGNMLYYQKIILVHD